MDNLDSIVLDKETLKKIRKAIDKKLYETGKAYLTLIQVNKLLVHKGIISVKDKHDQKFKMALENDEYFYSYRTVTKPRQWRCTMSTKGHKKYFGNEKESESDFFNFNDKQIKWGIGIIIFVTLFIYVNYFSNNTDESYITQPNNIASFSESNLDRAIQYNANNDTNAFMDLMLSGDIFELDSGSEVYAVKSKYGKVKIRFKGSGKEVWVLSKAIKYK